MNRHCRYCDGIAQGSILKRIGVVDEYREDSDEDKSSIDIILLCGDHLEEVEKLLTKMEIKVA